MTSTNNINAFVKITEYLYSIIARNNNKKGGGVWRERRIGWLVLAWFGYEVGEMKDERELEFFRAVGGGFTALYPPVMHWVGALVPRSGSV